ncbi:BMP family ABC transporter substrate-binding protein [Serpentinicella sp. ANB-PHB4]|uniref:BMP family lipoprotein n=1 Tax=Serpentinicella sp. ANB-PHB4 TaxID=3074076 RepID=UPI002861BA66|nr:BMP family ABC transporter substrate-binding protein [Serpentinicella sp. ANB-PHB4]MDR5659971.1 BMP family ABC transporter substrate-binding protein [Serpentinicella sp. ANB-PHB4]
MRKRSISFVLVAMLIGLMLAGCTQTASNDADLTRVGMVTDSGTIDDKSFNQGTWEGVKAYESDKGTITTTYQQPDNEAETDYLNAIADLVDTNYEIIVTPGFKFETAIYQAQQQYPDTTFILIDGTPNDGNWESEDGPDFLVGPNTVSVYFHEEEAGFLVGIAAALSSETGKVGFIGGMEIPPVQKFGWGYQAGVQYANDHFGTNTEITEYVYEGSFVNISGGQQIASGMYDSGIDIIFHAAGGVGVGIFSEAIERATGGEDVFVIGVDIDQYEEGLLSEDSDRSVTLTSAMKALDVAAYDYIDAKLNGTFPGGEEIRLSLADNGVGIPDENPNLSEDTLARIEEAKQAILNGEVVVPATQEDLDAFLK